MAKKGDNDALYLLGLHYIFGVGVNRDRKEAFKIFKNLAENESPITNYLSGDKEIIINKVDDFYSRLLTENRHLNANIILGYCYIYGVGTEVNHKKAFDLFKKIKKNGCVIAQYILRSLYIEDNNETRTFECHKKSTDKRFSKTQLQFGKCYSEGIGSEINERKVAFELYREAAKKGHDLAKCDLADCYQNGKGVEKDERKAFELYKETVAKGYDWAKFKLAECYQNGKGVEKDEKKAVVLYEEVANDGYIWACNKLGDCYQNGKGVEKDERKAFELYNKVSAKVERAGRGEELAKDLNEVSYWYQKSAADYDNELALYKLGEIYELGKGVNKNEARAFDYYKQAAEKDVYMENIKLENTFLVEL
ncbi:unnamed protein product [Rhizophagus irregularis]|nr:unnamed protein product [Rhizophagus irregularis]